MDQDHGLAGEARGRGGTLTGNGTGLMIGVLAAIGAALVALALVLVVGFGHLIANRQMDAASEREATTVAARAVDTLKRAGTRGNRPWTGPSRIAVPLGSPGGWFSNDDYPPDARRAGAEGRTVVQLLVQPDGRAHDCRITKSSGNEALDRATCKLAVQHGRFAPARDRSGRAIASTYQLPGIRWQLED